MDLHELGSGPMYKVGIKFRVQLVEVKLDSVGLSRVALGTTTVISH